MVISSDDDESGSKSIETEEKAPKRKRSLAESDEKYRRSMDEKIISALEVGLKEETEGELYGKIVAKKLDSFSAFHRTIARQRIDQILAEIEFYPERFTAPTTSDHIMESQYSRILNPSEY